MADQPRPPADTTLQGDLAHSSTHTDDAWEGSSITPVLAWVSGSAAIPPPAPRRRRWALPRRIRRSSTPAPVTPTNAPPLHAFGTDDREFIPAVDPWAGQDTPWLPATADPTLFPPEFPQPEFPQPEFPQPEFPQPGFPELEAATGLPSQATGPAQNGSAARSTRRSRTRQPARATRPPQNGRPVQVGRPPAGRLPAPPRRRRWPRTVLVFTLLSAACCCGVPGYFVWPAAHQYPVSAVLPTSIGDLSLRDDSASQRAADRLSRELIDADLVADDVFAAVYGDDSGKRVTLFGMTGFRLTPQADLDAELQHLADRYGIDGYDQFDLYEAGAHERCGVGHSDGDAMVLCGWADHGSLVTALLTRRSMPESASLVAHLRQTLLTR